MSLLEGQWLMFNLTKRVRRGKVVGPFDFDGNPITVKDCRDRYIEKYGEPPRHMVWQKPDPDNPAGAARLWLGPIPEDKK